MTEWFSKKPGSHVHQGVDDPTMLLVGAGAPDWVTLPPELGGTKAKVLGAFQAPCPMCAPQDLSDVPHLAVEGDNFVAECLEHGFAWYRKL